MIVPERPELDREPRLTGCEEMAGKIERYSRRPETDDRGRPTTDSILAGLFETQAPGCVVLTLPDWLRIRAWYLIMENELKAVCLYLGQPAKECGAE